MDNSNLIESISYNIRQAFLIAAILVFGLLILFSKHLKDSIVGPIILLRTRIREIRNSEYSPDQIGGDEITLLTKEFEDMCVEIMNHERSLEEKNQRLEYLVYNDDITGAYNKRYFRKHLNDLFDNPDKGMENLSLALIDIDNFGFYGEQVGRENRNETLKKLYEIISSTVDECCTVCFDGADEFRLIMKDMDYKKALDMIGVITNTVHESSFVGMESLPTSKVTLSSGLANYPKDAMDAEKLVDAAKDRLQRTKSHNKGKIGYFYSIFKDVKDEADENRKALIYMSKAFLSVIDAMDEYTYTHTEGVIKYSQIIAEEMGLEEKLIEDIKLGALLHDIGKLELGRDILNKKEKLSDAEIAFIKQHPLFGVNMLKTVEHFDDVVNAVKYHHERYDGCGYPFGLHGEEVPLAARIVAIADSFDAMTTTRAYRNVHKSYAEAVEELRKCAGKQFDPAIVDTFCSYAERNNYSFLIE